MNVFYAINQLKCLVKDKEQMLAFYDFPAIHWQHIRTINPIESTFATVRLRTEKRWRKLRGFKLLADVIDGVKFIDGKKQETENMDRAH